MASEILALQWLEHSNIFNQAIGSLRNKSAFTDATLACEGKFYPVHKFVLSTCSEYFSAIFDWTPCVNPVVVINNIPSQNLESLLDFMYRGETHVQECHIQDVMKAAECLHIKGLSLHQDNSAFKNRARSPVDLDEPKKKRRKSDGKKRCLPFVKPHLQGEFSFTQQLPSFTAKTSTPITLSHLTSSQHPIPSPHSSTPSIHSPSLHSGSPAVLSSASSPASQHNLQSSPSPHVPSPKSLLIPINHTNVQTHPIKMVTHQFKETSTSSPVIEAVHTQIHHQRNQFTSLKEEPTHLVLSSIPNLVSTTEGSPTVHTISQPVQFSTSNIIPSRPTVVNVPQNIGGNVATLPHMEQKMITIGEELHLEGPVKELEITTEDGTVSIPEILEGLVDMRQLYDTKVTQPEDIDSHDGSYSRTNSESKSVESIAQCSTSGTPVAILHFKEETNDSMYEFTEEIPETSGIGRINMLKDKNLRTYSNNGVTSKRKSVPLDSPTKSPSDGESSKVNTSELSSEDKKEVKGPFVCTTCDRVCKKKDSLTRHMRTHSEFPYTCTVCSLKCKAYKEFINHRKIHATKRCDKCEFVTIRNDNLRRHMQSHQKEKTHKCPYDDCKYSSNRLSLLNAHVQNHHTKKDSKDDHEEEQKK